jgi:hypothetical protein
LFAQADVEQIVMLPFFDNLMPSFEAQLANLDATIIDAKELELRQRYRMVFDKARTIPTIYLGTFHRMGSSADASCQDAVAAVLARLSDIAHAAQSASLDDLGAVALRSDIAAMQHETQYSRLFRS